MITLIHGEYIEASRNELIRLKTAAYPKDIREIDGKNLDESDLIQSLESLSLFGGETFIVIERLFEKLGRQQKRIESLIDVLKKSQPDTQVILWEEKVISPSVLKLFGDTVSVKFFPLPRYIFQLLDSMKPGNTRQLLATYGKMSHIEAPELVFSMIVKRIRQLIQVADNVTPIGISSWQMGKLTSQAKSFTMEKLLALYRDLYMREASIKTGMSAFSMQSHIEQFLISL